MVMLWRLDARISKGPNKFRQLISLCAFSALTLLVG